MQRHPGALSLGMRGDDVLRLKVILCVLNPAARLFDAEPVVTNVPAIPRAGALDLFDKTTADELRAAQTALGLPATGSLDDVTRTALDAALDGVDRFAVYGFVRTKEQHGVDQAQVTAFDRDLRSEQELGSDRTRRGGFYLVVYARARFGRAEKASADLTVRVRDAAGTRTLGETDVVFNAARISRVDVLVEKTAAASESEFERNLAAIGPLLAQVQLHELTMEDLAFLHGETAIPADQLRFLRLDADYRRSSSIKAGIFYGLLRERLPVARPQLVAESRTRLRAALERAIASGVIPAKLGTTLDATLDALRGEAVKSASDPNAAPQAARVVRAVASAEIAKAVADRFVDFALDHDLTDADFWDKAREAAGLNDTSLEVLRFTLTADALTFGHSETLKALQTLRKDRGWKTARDLATLSREGWRTLAAGSGRPDDFPDASAYGDAVADRVEDMFPTAVVAARLTNDSSRPDADLRAFFEANPHVELLTGRVDDYLRGAAGLDRVADPGRLRLRLLAMQNVMRLLPGPRRYDLMAPLIDRGFTSTLAILSTGQPEFMSTMMPIVGEVEAGEIFRNAEARGERTQMLGLRLRDFLADGIHVIPPFDPEVGGPPPTWARLFGSLNACACESCRSMYSPAAYLLDLLQLLKDTPGAARPLRTLSARRPDLEHIKLNCANANTLLPHIDLANEIFEAAVAGAGVDWRDYQTTEAAGEEQRDRERRLRAGPERELAAAYARLEAAEHPWLLPFSLGHQRVRVHARQLGLSLPALYTLFGRDQSEIVRAELELSGPEWRLLTRPDSSVDARRVWGAADTAALEQAATFLDRSGLSFDELSRLTETWFLSAEGMADVGVAAAEGPDVDPCEVDSYRLTGLRDASGRIDGRILDQIHRFVRLARHLDWPSGDLDAVLAPLGHRAIGEAALGDLARAIRLAATYKAPIARIMTDSALGELIGLSDLEVSSLSSLVEVSDETVRGRLSLLERWNEIERSGFEVRELLYILQGRDQTPPVFAPAANETREFLRAVHALVGRLRSEEGITDDAVADAISDNLARRFELEPDVADRLVLPAADPPAGAGRLPAVLRSDRDPARSAIAELLDFAAIAAGDRMPDDAAPALYDAAAAVLTRLDRAARLLRRLSITRRELDVIVAIRTDNGFLDLDQIRSASRPADLPAARLFEGWVALVDATRTRTAFPAGERGLFDLLAEAADPANTEATLLASINRATGWSIDPATGERFRDSSGAAIDVPGMLRGSMGIDRAAFRKAATYARLQQAVAWLRRWRILPGALVLWGDPASPAPAVAASLETAARARYRDEREWHGVVAPLIDQLREQKRDALLAYLIAHPPLVARGGSTMPAWTTPGGVYAHFLLDPEVSSCMLTSRIRQAIAGVQLFIQRILMSLEDGLHAEPGHADAWRTHWQQWQWMKNYRVWEAGRKVFLYPENWLRPELRDDKSPLFRQFEDGLLQDEVTDTTAQRLFRDYLGGLRQVSRLDVRAFYLERRNGSGDLLHVFARTFTEPHVHFYRRRQVSTGVWTAWDKIDANIEGDHLIPVAYHGELMLFWPQFREIGDGSRAELSLSTSTYRDGRWQAGRIGSARLRVPAHAHKDFAFRVEEEDGQLRLLVFRQYYQRGSDRSAQPESFSLSTDRFVFNVCDGTLNLETVRPVRVLLHPPRTDGAEMLFEEEAEGDGLYLTGDPIARDTVEIDPEIHEALVELIEEGGLGGVLLAVLLGGAAVIGELQEVRDQIRPRPVLSTTPTAFMLVPAHQERQFAGQASFFFQDWQHSFLATPDTMHLALVAPPPPGGRPGVEPPWRRLGPGLGEVELALPVHRFEIFSHPYICDIVDRFHRDGVEGLLAPAAFVSTGGAGWRRNELDRQYTAVVPSPLEAYVPTSYVWRPLPAQSISFDLSDAYADYNWELFFHIPLLVATRLSESHRFDDAQRWFHYIFDPTATSPHPVPARFWRLKPFFELAARPPTTLAALLRLVAGDDPESRRQVEVWRADPFNPHVIARLRNIAYMKAVVMGYLDNLIAWGDDLFTQDTLESIGEATQLYILALEILGPRPVTIPVREAPAYSFAELNARGAAVDELGNAWLELEALVPSGGGEPGGGVPRGGRRPRLMPYFCIPPNEKLRGYWDTVADRLFKIRHCMNIEGRVRELPLVEPPIDPALLVRARAAGVDLRSVLARRTGLPRYRYSFTLQKALDFSGEVRALGGALLAALDKRDAETLAALRAGHESRLLAQVSAVKDRQVDEGRETLESLRRSRALVETRQQFYSARQYRNQAEQSQISHLQAGRGFEIAAQSVKSIAPLLYSIPNITVGLGASTTFGGTHLGSAVAAAAEAIGIFSSQYAFEANMSSLTGQHDRRSDDWKLQADLADRELAQIDRQIAAAEIRVAILEKERDNNRTQIAQAQDVEEFLRAKFTSRELYAWTAGQVSALYYRAYQTALDLAFQAQAAAELELGLPPGALSIVGFEHWDSTRKGLLAGERLHQELRRLDALFLERNERRLEMTRHVSIATLDPVALVDLKTTGRCRVSLPEWLFDLDYPGHCNRRIKSVSLTIPCVTGPYTNVSATLSLEASRIRYRPDTELEPSPLAFQSIATSSAQNDSGVFDLSFRDERYLPFEGSGVVSDWLLELSGRWQIDLDEDGELEIVDVAQFDFDSITDAVLHVSYTAQEAADGGTLKRRVISGFQTLFSRLRDAPLARLLALKYEFAGEWHRFLHPPSGAGPQSFALALGQERFPFLFRHKPLVIAGFEVYVRVRREFMATHNPETLRMVLAPGAAPVDPGAARPEEIVTLEGWHDLLRGTTAVTGAPGPWTVTAWLGAGERFAPEAIEDLVLVCRFAWRAE